MNVRVLSLGLAAVWAVPFNVLADDVTDLYFQEVIERYFEYPQNARTFGMAGSSVQTSRDSSSVIGNPAGLGFMQEGEFSGTYSYNRISGDEFPTGESVDQTSNAGSGIIAVPVGPVMGDLPMYGNFGLAWTGSDANWNDDTFNTLAERTQVVASYAYPISRTLSLGYSLGWTDDKFQSREIFDYPMGDGFRHTLGVQWHKSPDVVIGGSFMIGHGNHHALFGPGIEANSDTLEFGFDSAIEYQVQKGAIVVLGVDYRHLTSDGDVVGSIPANVVGGDENGNLYNIRLGLEYPIEQRWVFRAGYRYAGLASYKYSRPELNDLNGSANYNAITLGAGAKFPIDSKYIRAVNIDYGVEYRAIADGDWQHVVTVVVPFGICR